MTLCVDNMLYYTDMTVLSLVSISNNSDYSSFMQELHVRGLYDTIVQQLLIIALCNGVA